MKAWGKKLEKFKGEKDFAPFFPHGQFFYGYMLKYLPHMGWGKKVYFLIFPMVNFCTGKIKKNVWNTKNNAHES